MELLRSLKLRWCGRRGSSQKQARGRVVQQGFQCGLKGRPRSHDKVMVFSPWDLIRLTDLGAINSFNQTLLDVICRQFASEISNVRRSRIFSCGALLHGSGCCGLQSPLIARMTNLAYERAEACDTCRRPAADHHARWSWAGLGGFLCIGRRWDV